MDTNAKSPMDDIKKLGEILMKRTSEKGNNKPNAVCMGGESFFPATSHVN